MEMGRGVLILRMGAYNTGIFDPGGLKIMGSLKFYDTGWEVASCDTGHE